MAQTIVKILNTDKPFTSFKRALSYVNAGRAIWEDPRTKSAIWFLPEGKLIATRHKEDRAVTGNFAWYVGDSGGSKLVRGYNKISGGTRVLMAQHGIEQ